MVDIWLLLFLAAPSAVSEMFGLIAIFCTTSGKASVIMAGYRASICHYLVQRAAASLPIQAAISSLQESRESGTKSTSETSFISGIWCPIYLFKDGTNSGKYVQTAICGFFVLLHIIANCVFLNDLLCCQKKKYRHTLHRKIGTLSTSDKYKSSLLSCRVHLTLRDS